MEALSIKTLTMPAAELGPENPLPEISPNRFAKKLEYPPDLPDEMLENFALRKPSSSLPYSIQDGYSRRLQDREFKVAVLENNILEATFLLEFGGRLWSLLHKPSGRQLLEVNPVFQLANLAIRNAWFSGGVEWNIGATGHSPFTCSPLFACRVEGEDGLPILRMYEWERFRQTPFHIDVYLPENSPVLFIHSRIINPNNHAVPIYWWSNIAVPETQGTRVLAPANTAYCLGFHPDYLDRVPVPEFNDIDYTYSPNMKHAADIFFDLQDISYPWIAALDKHGQGLVQVSTKEMIGRKLWVWGTGRGGRNWQRLLSPPGNGYIEIQAGLTRTQLEYMRLSPVTSCSWLEALGYLDADSKIVHGTDWQGACAHVENELQRIVPEKALIDEHQRCNEFVDRAPEEYFLKGSGWGALESKRQSVQHEKGLYCGGLEFGDETISKAQQPWSALLETGRFPEVDVNFPGSTFVSQEWEQIIQAALMSQDRENWFAWYQAGIVRYQAGNFPGAEIAWKKSLESCWTPWATRNLGVLAWHDNQINLAADLLVDAFHGASDVLPLAVECGKCLIEAGRHEEWLEIVKKLPKSMKSNGRIRFLEAQASLTSGNLDNAERFFIDNVVLDDLREGDNSISDLWREIQLQKKLEEEDIPPDHPQIDKYRKLLSLPEEIDFRLNEKNH